MNIFWPILTHRNCRVMIFWVLKCRTSGRPWKSVALHSSHHLDLQNGGIQRPFHIPMGQKDSERVTSGHNSRMENVEKWEVQTKQRKVENLYELVMLTFDGVSPPISNHHFHHPARCLEPPRWPKPAKGAVPWLIDVDSQKINARCSKLGCETMIHSQRCEDLWCRSDAFQTHESHETKSRETMGQWESYPPDLLRLKAICLARCIPMQPQGCWIRSVPAEERGHACHVTEKLANA